MPAGASWPRYIAAVSAAMLSMFAGAQSVHLLYHPLQDFEARVELEKEEMMKKAKAEIETVVPASSPTPSR